MPAIDWSALLAFFLTLKGASFLICAAAYAPFIYGVLRMNFRPTLSAWMTWLILDVVLLASAIAKKEDVPWQLAAMALGCIAVLAVCAYKGIHRMGWSWIDAACMALVCLAFAGWAATGEPNTATALSLIAITIGSIPLAINAWKEPEREWWLPWGLNLAGNVLGVIAIRQWAFAGAAPPVVFTILALFFNWLIWRGLARDPNVQKFADQILLRD